MTGMQFLGPEKRARDLRSAANRLRWEIDCARYESQVTACLTDLAEAIAILNQISQTLNEKFPEGTPQRETFASRLEFYLHYHEVPR